MIFEKWFHKGNKYIGLKNYRKYWDKPRFNIDHNGAKRSKGDKCFDFYICLGYLKFSYTNFDLQRQVQ